MLPVAILPAAAIITGIGNALNALHIWAQVALFFTTVGSTILEQLGILFAIGVAIGMAKNDGAVALAAVTGYLLVTVVLSPAKIAPVYMLKENSLDLAFHK